MIGISGFGIGGDSTGYEKIAQNVFVGLPVFVVVWIVGADLIYIIMNRYSELLAESATLLGTVIGIVLVYVVITKYSGLLQIVIMWGAAALVLRFIATMVFHALGYETGGFWIYIQPPEVQLENVKMCVKATSKFLTEVS